jgi:hypothetical protein
MIDRLQATGIIVSFAGMAIGAMFGDPGDEIWDRVVWWSRATGLLQIFVVLVRVVWT